jgi:hypothetical protein
MLISRFVRTATSTRRDRVAAMHQWLENFVVSVHGPVTGPLEEAKQRQVEEALRELEDSLQRLRNHNVHRVEQVTTNYDAILQRYFEKIETRREYLAAEWDAVDQFAVYDPQLVTTERYTVESVGPHLAMQIPDHLYWALAAVVPALWSFWTDADDLDRLRDLIRSFTKHVDHLVEQVLKSLGAPQRIHEFISKTRVFHLIHGAHPPDVSASPAFSLSA